MNESHRETGATAHRSSSVVTGVTRKVIVSAAVGSFVLAVSAFSDQSLVDGLLLSILIGGIVLLVQFLSDFEHRLDKLEESQRVGLERVNDATQLYSKAELSPLSTTRIKLLVDRAGQLDRDTTPLLLSLAGVQLERVSRLLKNILEHHEEAADAVTYDGEDRDWLLDLTELATESIDAVSLSTVDAGVSSFDGGLWGSDLGRRYLEKQSEATDRGVRIRRLFYFDNPLVSADESFRTLCLHQDAAGIEVRVLGEGMGNVSQRLRARIFDFIVFDRQLMYEMQSVQRVQRGVPPETFTTRLAGSPNRVGDLCRRFDELWAAAETPSWLPEPKVNGAALPRPVAPVEDAPATDSAAG